MSDTDSNARAQSEEVGIRVFTQIFMCLLGIAFMFGAHYATGTRGAFSHGPLHPISKGGRVIIFLAGMAVFVAPD